MTCTYQTSPYVPQSAFAGATSPLSITILRSWSCPDVPDLLSDFSSSEYSSTSPQYSLTSPPFSPMSPLFPAVAVFQPPLGCVHRNHPSCFVFKGDLFLLERAVRRARWPPNITLSVSLIKSRCRHLPSSFPLFPLFILFFLCFSALV